MSNPVDAAPEPEEWPPELEICVEYCTRSVYHARYDPDKYIKYFNLVEDEFRARSAPTKIVGNPFTGRRRVWKVFDKFGPLAEDIDVPRLGSFEVTVNSEQTGQVTIFSKLETRHWPNPRILVIQVDRLLRGETLLQPLPTGNSPRKRIQNDTGTSWAQNASPRSNTSPRSNASPERTPKPTPLTSPKK
jgi:hypothetical protein